MMLSYCGMSVVLPVCVIIVMSNDVDKTSASCIVYIYAERISEL